MATISVNKYLDEGSGSTLRTPGEAWVINNGATFTVRTDTRWHVNTAGSRTESLAAITCNEGEVIFDGRNVRWLPYGGGSGSVPNIGTTVSQASASASGYLLGVWNTISGSPYSVGTGMPPTGFLKFREVSGSFTSGSFTGGISASAVSADVTGWIEIVSDAASDITVPRLGKHTIRGDWFYLDNTSGSVGQLVQIPTNGGGTGTRVTGVWIETAPTSGSYNFFPALFGPTNGWDVQHLGNPYNELDRRQNFVKDSGSGVIQIGEVRNLSLTYTSMAAQASTYASHTQPSTYTWSGSIVAVNVALGHYLKTGQQIHLDFTSGGATAYDAIYTATVIDAYNYTVPLAGAGASGNLTGRAGFRIGFTAHTLGIGDNVHCDFTSGSIAVDGSYQIYAVQSADAYFISAPHATTTSGNVSVYSRYQISNGSIAHNLAVGNRTYLDFTSGCGIDGNYTIVTAASSVFNINANTSASVAASGNVTVKQIIGYVPPAGCRIRIPNVILRECATGARATNSVNGTIGSRPEWVVSAGGYLDFEFMNSTWYNNFAQAFNVRMHNCATTDTVVLTEVASGLDIDNLIIGSSAALDARMIQFTSCFAGGAVKNVAAHRAGAVGNTDHAIEVLQCNGINFTNVQAGIVQYARGTGKAIQVNSSNNLTFTNCKIFNSDFPIVTSTGITVTNLDYTDRYIGYTNATTGYYAVNITTKANTIDINGLTFGLNGAAINVHPYNGLFTVTNCDNIKLRNAGTSASPLSGGTFRPSLYGSGYVYVTGANNNNVKIQRCYMNPVRTGLYTTINSDKNLIYESLWGGMYTESASAIFLQLDSGLNSINKGIRTGANSVAANTSVYGTHFHDMFLGDTGGRFYLALTEPTSETASQFTMVSGSAKFNSAGGILMNTIGNQCIWEDSVYRKGITGFASVAPVFTGASAVSFQLSHNIDTGTGYSASWVNTSGSLLNTLSINPAVGFKMKYRIVTIGANNDPLRYIRVDTITSASTQAASTSLYPLDTVTLTLTGLIANSDIVIYAAGTTTVLGSVDSNNTTTWGYTYETAQNIDIGVFKTEYVPFYIRNYALTTSNASIPIAQVVDRAYLE